MYEKDKNSRNKTIKKIQKWAENEIAEYEEFIQIIRKELRGRRK